MAIEKIGIIGTGGVGGYFGGKLCLNSAIQLYFIARGPHLEAIQKNGLLLSTEQDECICKPTLATDRFTDLPVLDLALVCVKAYDLEAALDQARCAVSRKTILIPLLNGVDIYERIKRKYPDSHILPACVYIGTGIERPGKVIQRGGSCIITFGPDPADQQWTPHEVFHLFDVSGIRYQWVDNPLPAIWTKFLFIAPFGLVTACFNKNIGQVRDSSELSMMTLSVMQEILALAKKSGVSLSDSALADTMITVKNFPAETQTSFQRDFADPGKPDERDVLGGTILRLGRAYGVPTPVTEDLMAHLEKQKKLDI
ncbi:MAG: 2-dehydropantoate 2-reductase [Syntrophaceae bacterium]|nr:2-dehydropantoate 2-reductase [Syntrophaceae bacterium]